MRRVGALHDRAARGSGARAEFARRALAALPPHGAEAAAPGAARDRARVALCAMAGAAREMAVALLASAGDDGGNGGNGDGGNGGDGDGGSDSADGGWAAAVRLLRALRARSLDQPVPAALLEAVEGPPAAARAQFAAVFRVLLAESLERDDRAKAAAVMAVRPSSFGALDLVAVARGGGEGHADAVVGTSAFRDCLGSLLAPPCP